ncbi:MAG: amino acid ABC transporter substrate-binding protein [Kiritimatiellae bacterium]|nr:amino acid ABC transporter substrate-binding protein [Kiritimatiellia bacterium]
MKRIGALLGAALTVWSLSAEEAPLVLLTTTDTPPYSYRDEATGEIVGVEIDIARYAADKLGRKLEIRKAKFPELIPMVSSGQADLAASGITITEGRLQAVDFSIPYATEGGMFLYRTGDRMPTMILAETLRVATMDASTYDFYLSAHGIDPIRYDSYPQALADLKAGRLDTVFFDSCAVRLLAESDPALSASRLETRENFGIVVGKGNSELKAALDEAIAGMGRQ